MTKFLPSRDFRVRQFGRGEPADQLRTAVVCGNAFFCTPPSAELGFVDEPTLGSTPPSRFPCTCVRCFGAAVGIYGRGACEYAREWREEPWPACVRNLSRDALRLVLKRRFEPGTFLRFDLENLSSSYSRTFFARVIQARAESGGEWALECALSDCCDEEEMQALLA